MLAISVVMMYAGYAQTKVSGVLIDSSRNSVLISATVAVYPENSETVEKVTLTDRYGRFEISELPSDINWKVVFTFQGFEKKEINVRLKPKETKRIGNINMFKKNVMLETVDIKAPVTMNGDTIEFNADAFRLDSTAVIGDLLYKLPGITVWGDGKITYKGKVVPRVIVNGKEFFGSDKDIALQNISKNAVEKLQIYDTRDASAILNNPNDQNFEMNIVLKEGMEKMIFGAISLGFGTSDHHDSNANLNYATRRLQSTVAFSRNNTNKTLNSIEQLLRSTVYKNISIMSNFEPDMNKYGQSSQSVLGGRAQYDFAKDNDRRKKSLLKADYLVDWNREISTDTSRTQLTSSEKDLTNERAFKASTEAKKVVQYGMADYQYNNEIEQRKISINTRLNLKNLRENNNSSVFNTFNYPSNNGTQASSSQHTSDGTEGQMLVDVNLSSKDISSTMYQENMKANFFDGLSYFLKWTPEWSAQSTDKHVHSEYRSFVDPSSDKTDNRNYQNTIDRNANRLLFGVQWQRWKWSNNFQNEVIKTNQHTFDLVDNKQSVNPFLTYGSDFKKRTIESSLNYQLDLVRKILMGREETYLTLGSELGGRIFNLTNSSTLGDMMVSRRFRTLLPKLALDYSFNKLSKYRFNIGTAYLYDENYPDLDQLVRIYDDLNPSFRYFGNKNLKKEKVNKIAVNISYKEWMSNGYDINFSSSYNIVKSGIIDSIIYDEQQKIYTVNTPMTGYLFKNTLSLNKSYSLKGGRSLSYNTNIDFNWNKSYQYLGDELLNFYSNSQTYDVKIFYAYNNRYSVGVLGNYNLFRRNVPTNNTINYSSKDLSVGVGASYFITKKLVFRSNLSSRHISFTAYNKSLVLINSSASYRLGKGNSFEVKIAGYDLLNQNNGIYINSSPTELTYGQRNNLNRYFLLSLTYFPRKFGL
ncbi:hypothetical protein M2408_003025 [Sphingobacterium sp. BIGb0165]|nr:hypothetical protein [Sphingobacterium sp. BIGb0165]